MPGRTTSGIIGILREVGNKWERRAPLSPTDVRILRELRKVEVLIQPSNLRIYTDAEYRSAGAIVTEDLTEANCIFGVQRPHPESLIPNKTYAFFSRTIKAQPSSMPLLDAVLSKNIRLFDYECITEDGQRGGKRLVSFGHLCGTVGMINTFRGLGERFLSMGYSTPFLGVSSAYMYPNLKIAKTAVETMGKEIARNGLPRSLSPLTFVFTGNGQTSQGAQEIFRAIPHEFVKPSDLKHLKAGHENNKLYGCIVTEEDMVFRRRDADERKQNSIVLQSSSGNSSKSRTSSTAAFDNFEYHAHPELYTPQFHENIAPYANVIMNCIYWDRRFPRLLTNKQAQHMMEEQHTKGKFPGLTMVSDISCDINGAIQFTSRSSSIDHPFYLADIAKDRSSSTLDGEGVVMMAVDKLAGEMPREATRMFGSSLLNFAADLANSDGSIPFEEQAATLSPPLLGACIAAHGKLTPSYTYIEGMRRELNRKNPIVSQQDMVSTTILLQGHLFDTALINKVLDHVEVYKGGFDIRECLVRPNQPGQLKSTSSAVINIQMPSREDIDQFLKDLRGFIQNIPASEATVSELENFE